MIAGLSAISDEISQDFDTASRAAAEMQLNGLEIRSVWNKGPLDLTRADCRSIREIADRRDLSLVGLSSPCMKQPMAEHALEAAAEELRVAAERAMWLSLDWIRVFSFFRPESGAEPHKAARLFREVVERAAIPDSIQLLLETGTRTNTPTAATTQEFLEAVALPLLVLWDPGNSAFSGLEPEVFPAAYRTLQPRIAHVHVKDPASDGSGYVPLLDGTVPWRDIILALVQDGYTGWLSLETHWRRDRVLTPSQRDRPLGDEFSSGGEIATAECARTLAELVDSAVGLQQGTE